jgi:hypothetical protein
MPTKLKYTDYPLTECALEAERLMRELGADVYQKFSCDGCGSRQTVIPPNVFHIKGKCQECGHITDILAKGCNYMVIMGTTAHDA